MADVIVTSGTVPALETAHYNGASAGAGVTVTTSGARLANRFPSVLSAMLKATETNRSVSGCCFCCDNDSSLHNAKPWATSGGWVTLMQNDNAPTRAEQPFAATRQLCVLHPTGDMPSMGLATFQALYPVVLTAMIRRIRAGSVYFHTDASMTYTGTWATATATNKNSGSGYRYSTQEGCKSKVTVPSTVLAGSKLHWQCQFTHSNRPTLTFTKNGAPAGGINLATIPAFNSTGPERFSPYSHEFTVNPGDVIECTYTALNGGRAHFDSYSIEAYQPPIVAIVMPWRFTDYSIFTSAGYPYTPSDADADEALAAVEDAIENFPDGRVVRVDVDDLLWDGSTPRLYLLDDYAHPNARGAALIAARIFHVISGLLSAEQVACTGTI